MAFTEKRLAGPTELTANTETNLYVCPTAQTTTTQIKQVLVTNTGAATTFDLSLVPQGGTAGTANRLFSALALSANETVLLDVSQVMSSGDFISAKSGAGSTVNVTISGVENSGLMVISGLADSAVTTAKIADGNITVEKLGPDIFADIFQSNVVTSTTRPLTPFEGQVIYETDTNINQQYDGANWGPTYPGSGFRNLVINGDMRVNQRNTAITAGSYTAYTVDRWYVDNVDAGVRSIAQNTDSPPGFSHSLRMTATTGATSSGMLRFGQRIENLNCSNLAYGTSSAKTVGVSFWVKSSVVGTYSVRLQTGAQAYLAPYTINVANTWEYKTVFIPGNTTTVISDYLDVQFMIHAGSLYWGTSNQWLSSTLAYATSGQVNAMATTGNIFAITGVQLEANPQPTPFEQRPIGVELALCQRYFYRITGNTNARFAIAGNGSLQNSFPTTFLKQTMRAQPTIDFSSLSHFVLESLNGTGTATPTLIGYNAGQTEAVTVICSSGGNNTASAVQLNGATTGAWLAFSAEL